MTPTDRPRPYRPRYAAAGIRPAGRSGAAEAGRHQAPRPARPVRADIQALRAIAVLCVVVNHLWPAALPGGYVGVDVFFVVSGFLITLHLLGELESTGRIRLGRFYARRARRLLPAAYLVALLGLAATVALLPPARWRDAAFETFAASAYFENWLLAAKSVDYSAHNAAATTVQHYWSLSVEEQFYLLWPLLLIAGFALAVRLAARRGAPARGMAPAVGAGARVGAEAASRWNPRLVVGLLLGLVALVSFVLACVLTATSRSEAYFVTQTRVWEFAAGSLLALASPAVGRALGDRVALRAGLQWSGLAMIAVSALAFGTSTAFPGPWALLPVLGTALTIAAGPTIPRFTPMRPLRARPVQFIGDISYSLYLWHWPLIVVAPFALSRDPGLPDRLALLALSVLLAWLTKALVEDPGRRRLLANLAPPRFFAVLAASLVAMLAVCASVVWAGQARLDAAQQQLAEREAAEAECFGAAALSGEGCGDPFAPAEVLTTGDDEAPWFDAPGCAWIDEDEIFNRCDFSEGADGAHVWLVGDSHAEHWKAAVLQIAEREGWVLTTSLAGGCPTVPVPLESFDDGANDNAEQQRKCLDWAALVDQRLADERPDLIITSSFSSAERIDDGTGREQAEQYRDAAEALAAAWRSYGARIAVIRDVPHTLDRATPECLAQHPDEPLACAVPRAEAVTPDPLSDGFAALQLDDVDLVDLTDRFCDGERCYALVGGVSVYFDRDHISRSYARSLTSDLWEGLRPALG